MKSIMLFFVVIVFLATAVEGSVFFNYYDPAVFTASIFFTPPEQEGLSFFFLPYSELINGAKESGIIDDHSRIVNVVDVFGVVDFLDYFDTKTLVNNVDEVNQLVGDYDVSGKLDEKIVELSGKDVNLMESAKPFMEPIEIIVTKMGIEPKEIVVKVNQPIVWKNKREKLQFLLMGMREINSMNSGFVEVGDSFTWTFSKPGSYIYADGIIIGVMGKIVVQ